MPPREWLHLPCRRAVLILHFMKQSPLLEKQTSTYLDECAVPYAQRLGGEMNPAAGVMKLGDRRTTFLEVIEESKISLR